MWPERLLQISQAIRDSVDGSRLGSFFNLARLSEPGNLSIEEYDAELLQVLQSLAACALDLFKLSDNLSVTLNEDLRAEIDGVYDRVDGLADLFSTSGEPSTLNLAGGATLAQRQALDFVVIAGLSDLCTAATGLSMAVEEEDQAGVSAYLMWVDSLSSNVEKLWSRRPQFDHGGDGPSRVTPEEARSNDFEAGLHLAKLRSLKLDDRPAYLKELSMIVHAVMEEVRGSREWMSLNEFFDRLSCVSLFLSIGFKDVMFCFAELLERGWTGGIKDVGDRQMLEIRQPDLGRLYSKLKEASMDAKVSTDMVMEKLELDYFTSLHIIKEM
ncbi:hypothetical protein E2P65_05975, partial [Candidatus Bathyarchaeota archaeon]